jgi:hypothetical protein
MVVTGKWANKIVHTPQPPKGGSPSTALRAVAQARIIGVKLRDSGAKFAAGGVGIFTIDH